MSVRDATLVFGKRGRGVISMRAMIGAARRFYFWYYAFPKPLAEEG
jgi:hypothetical protein